MEGCNKKCRHRMPHFMKTIDLTSSQKISYVAAIAIALIGCAMAPAYAGSSTTFAPDSPNESGGTGVSRTWSGYVATGKTFTAVSGAWVVPVVDTTASE